MEKLGISPGYLLVQIINFIILLVILRAWVYKPILNLLENRKKTIAQGVEDARIAGEARANAEQEANRIINEAQTHAGGIVKEATERAEVAAREVEEEARADAAKARDEALEQVKEERDRILSDLRGQVASLAIAVSNKLIGASLTDNEQRQRQLVDEFFSGVREGRLQMMQGAELSGASAEVVSALPLTAQEQDRVKQEVLSKIGSQSTVAFRVDPKILGGLIIRVGDKVLDDSVAGQLSTLGQSLA